MREVRRHTLQAKGLTAGTGMSVRVSMDENGTSQAEPAKQRGLWNNDHLCWFD